jgi:hypothetical protein
MLDSLSDVALIYLVLVALYVFESLAWTRAGCTSFASYFGRFASPTQCRKLIGNDSGAINTFGPATFDATIMAESCPISISSNGIVGFSAATPIAGDRPFATEATCEWEEIQSIRRVDREFWLNDRLICRTGSMASAKDLWETLCTFAKVGVDNRADAIDRFIDQQLDVGIVKQRIKNWQASARRLRLFSTLLWAWIFVVGVIRYQGWVPAISGPETLVGFLACLFIIWWTTCLLQFMTHRKLYPELRLNRAKHTFATLVSPAAAMRASDHLGRNLIGLRHPLAVAAVLLPKEQVSELAQHVLRDLLYPKLPDAPGSESSIAGSDSTAWAEVSESYRQATVAGLLRFCESNGLQVAGFDLPPLRTEVDALSYCPRCHQQFSALQATCTLCSNRKTTPFSGESGEV